MTSAIVKRANGDRTPGRGRISKGAKAMIEASSSSTRSRQQKPSVHGSMPRIIAQRAALIVLTAIYLQLLIILYRDHVVPMYDYFNFHWVGFSLENQLVSFLLIIPMVLLLPRSCSTLGGVIKWALVFAVFVPCLVIPIASGYVSQSEGPFFNSLVVASFLALHFAHFLASHGRPFRLPRLSPTSFILILVIAWIAIFATFLIVAGFSISLNPFADIYDTRAEFRENVSTRNAFLAYAVPLVAKVVNPLLIVIGISRRHPLLVVMGLFGSILVFNANAQKSVLLTIVMVPVVYFLLRRWRSLSAVGLSITFVGLATVSLFNPTIMELVFRRTIIVPGLLVGIYVNNFSQQGFVYLQHSIFGEFVQSDRLAPAREIGLNYWGRSAMSANANFLGDGFANFGYPGMLVFAGLLGLILGVADRMTRETSMAIVVASSIGVIFALIDTALLTTLITHGLIILVLLLAMFPKEEFRSLKRRTRSPAYTFGSALAQR
ncbi:hypothetical protein [Microbacterium sp.]|uniref:hypothetical protein n=1 Tax=Microbacterium sp. TaxID=51671 RepID=UPI00273631F6|nr:hypothetical protein [Microbacterium sp.]MDP3949102.1 hypothetical protein [Microbacterium sp.]